jgi:hypothetical protein
MPFSFWDFTSLTAPILVRCLQDAVGEYLGKNANLSIWLPFIIAAAVTLWIISLVVL